jgi:hypothetical protein
MRRKHAHTTIIYKKSSLSFSRTPTNQFRYCFNHGKSEAVETSVNAFAFVCNQHCLTQQMENQYKAAWAASESDKIDAIQQMSKKSQYGR